MREHTKTSFTSVVLYFSLSLLSVFDISANEEQIIFENSDGQCCSSAEDRVWFNAL